MMCPLSRQFKSRAFVCHNFLKQLASQGIEIKNSTGNITRKMPLLIIQFALVLFYLCMLLRKSGSILQR